MVALGLDERLKMADIVSMYQTNFESILEEHGGFRHDGNYYIPKDMYAIDDTETLLYVGFEEGNLNSANKKNGAELFTKVQTENYVSNAFFGDWSLKLSGNPNADSYVTYRVSGLEVGAEYRYQAYIYSPTVSTYMFARNVGDTGLGSYATVYDSARYVQREFVFVATAETMEIGVMLRAGLTEFKYSQIDELLVIKVEDKQITDKISLTSSPNSLGKYTGKIEFKVDEKIGYEAQLKITFANTMGKNVDATIYINGEKYAVAPIYKTGSKLDSEGLDTVYIPIVLTKDSNIVELDIGKNSIYIYDVSLVTVNERCG